MKKANNFMDGILIALMFCYFIPAIVAYERKNKNKVAVLILNIFLGWTILGWIIALVWAVKRD